VTKVMRIGMVLLGSGIVGALPAHGDSQPSPKAEIVAFEEGFNAALAHNDVPALQRLLASDWTIVSGDGQIISRKSFLEVIASGDLKHNAMSSAEPAIRAYGTTALVTARAKSSGLYRGVEFHTDEIGTDVLIKRQGQWVCVLTQLTTVVAR
jgi:hypothetical protein